MAKDRTVSLAEASNGDLLAEVVRRIAPKKPEAVKVEAIEGETTMLVTLDVAQEDAGAVIGKMGRRIQGVEALARAIAAKAGKRHVEFYFLIDGKKPEKPKAEKK